MDEKTKSQLVGKLSAASNFDPNYSLENRKWFLTALISALGQQGVADDQIQEKLTEILTKSKEIVLARRDFKLSLSVSTDYPSERDCVATRVEILYGIIAEDSQFADASGTNFASQYLNFIAARRYRAVVRMSYYVNPNEEGYFSYPDDCKDQAYSGDYQLNTDARLLWERINPKFPVPMRMTAQSASDPVSAVSKIWIPKQNICESNLLDCETTMSCVLMDSLLEAKDPASLLKAISAKGSNYLPIHFITSSWPCPSGPHANPPLTFLNDRTATALFVEDHVDPADLQVGDHVYVWNHPLYEYLHPLGDWRGEHAVVVACGNRKFNDGKGFLVSGHGTRPDVLTLAELRDQLWKIMNSLLNLVYAKAKIFLDYKAGKLTGLNVTSQDHDFTDNQGNTVHTTIYLFQVHFEFSNYTAAPMGSNQPEVNSGESFLVAYVANENSCAFPAYGQTIAGAISNERDRRGPVLVLTGTPTPNQSSFDPILWTLKYDVGTYYCDPNPQSGKYPLFKKAKNRVVFRNLETMEMPNPPFGRLIPDANRVLVTRPMVNFDAAYQSFLAANGGI